MFTDFKRQKQAEVLGSSSLGHGDLLCLSAHGFRAWARRFVSASLVAALVALICSAKAEAAFHEQLAIDAEAISLANNVTARPPGMLAIHYNPAGLSLLADGSFFGTSITLAKVAKTSKFEADPEFKGFAGDFNEDPLAGTEGTNSSGRMYIPFYGTVNTLIGPSLGFSYRKPGSKWTLAVGNYAPFAVGLVHGDFEDPARFGGQAVYQQHLIFVAPAVSYQVSKTLSVGASVGLGQTAMGARLDMRSPSDMVAMTRVMGDATKDMEIPLVSELFFRPPWFGGGVSPYDRVATAELSLRDDYSPSYNLGLLWSPVDWFSFGASYQSEIKVNLVGTYKIKYSDEWQRMVNWFGSTPTLLMVSGMLGLPNKAVAQQTGVITQDMTYPQMVNLGINLKPFKSLSLLGDLHWSNWSVMKKDNFKFDQKIQLLQFVKVLGYSGGDSSLQMDRNFKDTWNWGVGIEYQLLDWLALRAGYENRKSSTQDAFFDLLYALPDMDSYGAGVGLKMAHGVVIDLAVGYLINTSYKVKNNGSVNLNYSADFTKPVYNPYAGLNYEQKTATYMGSFKMTMPLETMQHMLHYQLGMVSKAIHLLNPIKWFSPAHPKAGHEAPKPM